MENIKQKIIAVVILILVVVGLVWLTMFLKNKNADTGTGEKAGIALFTKKNPGTKTDKNQGNVGNTNGTDFTGNDTTKPVSIIENIIQTITGNSGTSGTGTDAGAVSVNQGGIGQAIRDFFLGNDGLPANPDNNLEGNDVAGGEKNTAEIPGIDTFVDISDLNNSEIKQTLKCAPAVYISRVARHDELVALIKAKKKTESSLSSEDLELYTWKPTDAERDEDDMQRVLHRYWDIWSYPQNYLKTEGSKTDPVCGTWTDVADTGTGKSEDDFKTDIINDNTIAAAKREVRKNFSAISMIASNNFSLSQTDNQLLMAKNDNDRYYNLLNDCRVIRGQFEGGYTYDVTGNNRINIPQYYFPNQVGTATGRDDTPAIWTHEAIAKDLAARVKITTASKNSKELAELSEKSKKAKLGTGPELTDAEIKRYQDLMLEQRFGDSKPLGSLIRSDIVKGILAQGSNIKNAEPNILTKTTAGNISYLWDNDNQDYDLEYDFPKNKAENVNVFYNGVGTGGTAVSAGDGSNSSVISEPTISESDKEKAKQQARYYITMYPKLQYGGADGKQQLRGSTRFLMFGSSAQNAQNFNPGLYLVKEPQNVWELLKQDKEKVLYCRINKFMSMWAGIETNVYPMGYINSHGINCDSQPAIIQKPSEPVHTWFVIDPFGDRTLSQILNGEGNASINYDAVLSQLKQRLTTAEFNLKNVTGYNLDFQKTNLENEIAGLKKQISDTESEKQIGGNNTRSTGYNSIFKFTLNNTTLFELSGVNRDNWYTNSVQNAVFEFIRDED